MLQEIVSEIGKTLVAKGIMPWNCPGSLWLKVVLG
jgi:hypothetical protein